MKNMAYNSYDHDRLQPAENMRIERTIYFSEGADISGLAALPLERLRAMREESAAAEQVIYDKLREASAEWEEQAGQTLLFDKAIEYARTPTVKHTSNQWEAEEYHHAISNMVYQMNYHIYENTRYDRETKQSVPYSWSLTWSVRTNSPDGYRQARIAGQDRKVFADKAAMEKYLNGRIKAYSHLFTEISPPIPQEYAQQFKVNGQLLPGYTIEGEEPKQADHAAVENNGGDFISQQQNTEQRKERERMNDPLSIRISNSAKYENGEHGYWLKLPATAEQLHEAMKAMDITANNPQDFLIEDFESVLDSVTRLSLENVRSAGVDELNYLAAALQSRDSRQIDKLNAATEFMTGRYDVHGLVELTQNTGVYDFHPDIFSNIQLGEHTLEHSGLIQIPDEWAAAIDIEMLGQLAAEHEKGVFTEYGYIVPNGEEWKPITEIPQEYRIMSFPQPQRPDPGKADMDTISMAAQTAEQPQPRPVIPLILTSEKPAEKLKEITDRLEQGISELFDSNRYKEYLSVMSKFHNYSFNNTLLIAMQKPDASLIAGFSSWKNQFERNVKKGEKGIKIIAPSPFKVKKEMEKIDPQTQKPIIGKDGKPVTEEKEITIPAFKVVSVFDVSQTEGKELPDIAVDALTGDVEQYKDFFAALEKTSPVPVGFEKMTGGTQGYYHLEDKRIALLEGAIQLQTLKTLIHEIAHAKLHDIDLTAPKEEQQNRPDRRTREVEAESIAYTICQHYGLDTSDYSFGYVAGWSSGKELAELKSSLETIRSTAAEIINSIDTHMAEIQKAQEVKQEQPQEYIYKVHANPRSDSIENRYLLQAYIPQEDGTAKIGDILFVGTPGKCRELMGRLTAGELTQGQVKELFAKSQEQPTQETGQDENTYSIYQLKRGDETRDLRFEPYDRLQAAGHTVDSANYDLIYSAPLAPDMTLEIILEKFNIGHPKDFKGHSLSVSDVVVLHQNGQESAHYVDSFGYRQVPEFLQEQQKELTPDEFLTGEKITTPRGSFRLTSMSMEQMKEAGYGVHHNSEDGKYNIMANGTRAFAVAVEQPQNYLKHIEDTVEQNDNNFDGIINNTPQTPTVGELEQKAKAGEPISLTDLANAIKADKERVGKPEEKPSIRAQLAKDKEKAAPKKAAAKSKNHDLEV